jgi:hypothetical protein
MFFYPFTTRIQLRLYTCGCGVWVGSLTFPVPSPLRSCDATLVHHVYARPSRALLSSPPARRIQLVLARCVANSNLDDWRRADPSQVLLNDTYVEAFMRKQSTLPSLRLGRVSGIRLTYLCSGWLSSG